MAGNRSKTKGNNWERETANYLSTLYNKSFVRVPNSGAFIGKSNVFRKEKLTEQQIRTYKGDIIPPDEFPKALIECKSYGSIAFHSIVAGDNVPLLDSWIEQAKYDCDDGDVWMVVFKINHKGKFIVIDKNQFNNIELNNYCLYKNYYVTGFEKFMENNKESIAQKWQASALSSN